MSAILRHELLLSPGCAVHRRGDVLTLHTRTSELELRSAQVERLEALLGALRRGARPVDMLKPQEVGTELCDLLTELREDHLLLEREDPGAEGSRSVEHQVASLLRQARFWASAIFEQPFWSELLEGRCPTARVLGWGMEFFHFVDGANLYMPLGVAHARVDPQIRAAIARHYVEEMNHGPIFLEGLARCGLDRESILSAPPLPQTRALLNHLAELAIEGAVPYTAAFAVMQPGLTPPSEQALHEFYAHLSERYPYAAPMFRAFEAHARIDVELAHEQTVFERLCRHQMGLDAAEYRRAEVAMQSVAEAFILFFEGIADIPGDHGYAPRRPLGLGALL